MIDRETIKQVALEKFNRGQLEALTYCSGPYDVTEVCIEVFDFAERLLAAASEMPKCEP